MYWDDGQHTKVEEKDPWAGPGSKNNAPAAGDPATLVWGNQQHIFYHDNQNIIQHVFYDPNLGLQWAGPWGPGNFPAAGDPATLVTNNQQHVFYRDNQNNIQHVFWDDSTHKMTVEQWAGPSSF